MPRLSRERTIASAKDPAALASLARGMVIVGTQFIASAKDSAMARFARSRNGERQNNERNRQRILDFQ